MHKRVKVLVIDDSVFVRGLLARELAADPYIDVVDTASDPYEARDKIVRLRPDVLTLDIEMPRMNGVDFLKKLMPQFPLPVIMVSSLSEPGARITLEALEAGAVDFVPKPKASSPGGMMNMIQELRTKIKIAATVNVAHHKKDRPNLRPPSTLTDATAAHFAYDLIAIGASMGGTQALTTLLAALPARMPPILIVQHMPAMFTRLFAERVNETSALDVVEAKHGDTLVPGRAYIAPGGLQMRLNPRKPYTLEITNDPSIDGHAPSVTALFSSLVPVAANTISCILTGMGRDGATGMKEFHDAGGKTIGQDEASCVVYGMPKAAMDIGAVDQQVALTKIPEVLLSLLHISKH